MRAAKAALLLVFATGTANAADIEYGEYIAQECVACHMIDGDYNGIPVLNGYDEETFIDAMIAYQFGDRENAAMEAVVNSLDDEQIEAVAAYFASLETPEMDEDAEEADVDAAEPENDAADLMTRAKKALDSARAALEALKQ